MEEVKEWKLAQSRVSYLIDKIRLGWIISLLVISFRLSISNIISSLYLSPLILSISVSTDLIPSREKAYGKWRKGLPHSTCPLVQDRTYYPYSRTDAPESECVYETAYEQYILII